MYSRGDFVRIGTSDNFIGVVVSGGPPGDRITVLCADGITVATEQSFL